MQVADRAESDDVAQPDQHSDTGAGQASGVRLDLQMATASITAARYAALIQILTLQMQQTRTALGTT